MTATMMKAKTATEHPWSTSTGPSKTSGGPGGRLAHAPVRRPRAGSHRRHSNSGSLLLSYNAKQSSLWGPDLPLPETNTDTKILIDYDRLQEVAPGPSQYPADGLAARQRLQCGPRLRNFRLADAPEQEAQRHRVRDRRPLIAR